MFRVLGIIRLAFSLFLQLVPHDADTSFEDPGNFPQGIFSAPQDLNFTPLRLGEARPFLFFMLSAYCKVFEFQTGVAQLRPDINN